MVGATSSRSFSLSVAADANAGILNSRAAASSAAISALVVPVVPPRRKKRNDWTSRAVRSRPHRDWNAHPGLIPAHPATIAGENDNNNDQWNNSMGGGGGSGSPTSDDSSPASPTAATRAPSSPSVPVLAITCGAVGVIVAIVVVLALVYVRRIRRRVKNMKRLTNVLGPELAVPMSPSQLSQLTTIDSPRVIFDGKSSIFPPRTTCELLSPLSAVSVSSPTMLELPSFPLSPIRTSTIFLSPPPPAKRSPIRSSNPNLPPNPRSPIRSSRPAVPWPLITALNDHPQRNYEERNTSSSGTDASESTRFAFRR